MRKLFGNWRFQGWLSGVSKTFVFSALYPMKKWETEFGCGKLKSWGSFMGLSI
jgi:hypothetical protein